MSEKDFKAYLTYPLTESIREIALRERNQTGYILKIGGESMDCKHDLNLELRDDLLIVGGELTEYIFHRTLGKKKMFGVSVTTSVLNSFGIDAIRIRVSETTEIKMKASVSKIRKGFSDKGYIPKVCMWSKNGRL